MATLQFTHIDSADEFNAQQTRWNEIFQLHQQLRPAITDFDYYTKQIQTMLSEGAKLILARNEQGQLAALALYRMHHNTYQHKLCFLEDLVVNEQVRDTGVGTQVITYLEQHASKQGCHYLSLDSGTFRTRAHKFYYMNNYIADCFHFSKKL